MTDDQNDDGFELILDKTEYEDLEFLAKEKHMSISDVLSVALEEHFNEWKSSDEHERQLMLERLRSQPLSSPEDPVYVQVAVKRTARA